MTDVTTSAVTSAALLPWMAAGCHGVHEGERRLAVGERQQLILWISPELLVVQFRFVVEAQEVGLAAPR